MLSERERLQYLAAIGIEVWSQRNMPVFDEGEIPDGQTLVPSDRDAPADWQALRAKVQSCRNCELHETRSQTVFGAGNRNADWMIVGEAPGADEDRQGEPFVGAAGKMLDEILAAAGLDRNSVYIANILKCHPPGNRNPHQTEADSCREYLNQQIAMVQPKVILAVGAVAAHQLLQSDQPVGKLRGQTHTSQPAGVNVIVTYHPAYLLRSPVHKRDVWQDVCLARSVIGGLQD